MKRWSWRRILVVFAIILVIAGMTPLLVLLWHSTTHNFQPLSMQLPFRQGEYTSAAFKTDLNESYIVQVELRDATQRSIGLNPDAVLNLDWKIVDANGGIVAEGTQNGPMRGANNVNLGEYKPKRGLSQRAIVDVRRNIAEPEGSVVTFDVNSTEDAEGAAFGFILFSWWAGIVAGSGVVILLVMFILQKSRRRVLGTASRTRQTL